MDLFIQGLLIIPKGIWSAIKSLSEPEALGFLTGWVILLGVLVLLIRAVSRR